MAVAPEDRPEHVPPTEAVHPGSVGIDSLSTAGIVDAIHREDSRAWEAVGSARESIAALVDSIVEAFRAGGRLLYVGAGTSGRLGVLDASECLPTFGVGPDRVYGVIAGGDVALRHSVEGAEDRPEDGAAAVRAVGVRAADVVCGIAASGTTPYVWGALDEAASREATTALLTCNPAWTAASVPVRPEIVDFPIVLPVGPEILAGSSRMKAGTATKMVLNMLTTGAMIRWGKVYDNLMVDLRPTNAKLRGRAERIVARLAGTDIAAARSLLDASDGDVKLAVLRHHGLSTNEARAALERAEGSLRGAIQRARS